MELVSKGCASRHAQVVQLCVTILLQLVVGALPKLDVRSTSCDHTSKCRRCDRKLVTAA